MLVGRRRTPLALLNDTEQNLLKALRKETSYQAGLSLTRWAKRISSFCGIAPFVDATSCAVRFASHAMRIIEENVLVRPFQSDLLEPRWPIQAIEDKDSRSMIQWNGFYWIKHTSQLQAGSTSIGHR